MQTKRTLLRAALLRAALFASLLLGSIALPGLSATAAVGVAPTLEVAPATCDLLGATDILVQVGGLVKGETYLVSVDVASTRSAVDARQITGDNPTASLIFENLLNGDSYAVTIANSTNTLSATTTVTMPVCDLPTLPDNGKAPEGVEPIVPRGPVSDGLVNTGATTPIVPAIGGLGLIQCGLVLIGVAIYLARTRPSGA